MIGLVMCAHLRPMAEEQEGALPTLFGYCSNMNSSLVLRGMVPSLREPIVGLPRLVIDPLEPMDALEAIEPNRREGLFGDSKLGSLRMDPSGAGAALSVGVNPSEELACSMNICHALAIAASSLARGPESQASRLRTCGALCCARAMSNIVATAKRANPLSCAAFTPGLLCSELLAWLFRENL